MFDNKKKAFLSWHISQLTKREDKTHSTLEASSQVGVLKNLISAKFQPGDGWRWQKTNTFLLPNWFPYHRRDLGLALISDTVVLGNLTLFYFQIGFHTTTGI